MSMKKNTVVVCVSLKDERETDELKSLAGSSFLNDAEIHFVYVFKQNLYFNELSPYTFPNEEQFPSIEQAVEKILENVAKNIIPDPRSVSKIHFHCLFNNDPKLRMVEFLKDVKADLAVCSIRAAQGIESVFMSSFTDYLCKFAPCNVLVVKHPL